MPLFPPDREVIILLAFFAAIGLFAFLVAKFTKPGTTTPPPPPKDEDDQCNDPVPVVSEEDILRLVARDFPATECEAVLAALSKFRAESLREPTRLCAAILKLSGGDTSRLPEAIALARQDFRDALVEAESPRFCKIGFVGVDKLTKRARQKLIEDDWQQYQEWFTSLEPKTHGQSNG
jgi:hypothetical protein